jgi:hypothetical protein
MNWNAMYYRGSGPSRVQWSSTEAQFQDHSLQELLANVTNNLQPHYTTGDYCTGLLGTPGPYTMEFVSVNCDLKMEVSGTVCISAGTATAPNSSQVKYALHHWREIPEHLFHAGVEEYIPPHVNTNRFKVDVLLPEYEFVGNWTDVEMEEERRMARQPEGQWPWVETAFDCSPQTLDNASCPHFFPNTTQHPRIHH